MAKGNGLGDLLFVQGFDLSGDVGVIDRLASPSGVLDITAINASGHERIHSHKDGEISFHAFFNDATDQEHLALRAKGADADRVVCYFRGSTIGNVAAGLTAKQINYDGDRGADGSLVFAVQCLGNGFGLDYGQQLTAGKRTDTTATNGTGQDFGAATALGLAAYLQVFTFAGTSFTPAIQESSDDAAGDPYAAVTGGSFGAQSAVGASRIVTTFSLAVERWLRVVTTGTFSNAVFAVLVSRYPSNA